MGKHHVNETEGARAVEVRGSRCQEAGMRWECWPGLPGEGLLQCAGG